jgi:hypothetical protein
VRLEEHFLLFLSSDDTRVVVLKISNALLNLLPQFNHLLGLVILKLDHVIIVPSDLVSKVIHMVLKCVPYFLYIVDLILYSIDPHIKVYALRGDVRELNFIVPVDVNDLPCHLFYAVCPMPSLVDHELKLIEFPLVSDVLFLQLSDLVLDEHESIINWVQLSLDQLPCSVLKQEPVELLHKLSFIHWVNELSELNLLALLKNRRLERTHRLPFLL